MPAEERSTAMGIINAGTAVGSVLAPPMIGLILLGSGWRAVFFVAGAVGFAWTLWWWLSYRSNSSTVSVNTLDVRLLAEQLSIRELLGFRGVQALVFAKFMSDSAWFFLLFWLPKYLYDIRGFDVKQMSYFAWIPYAASGIGSFLGGWVSAKLLQSGRSLDFSRKLVLGINAAMMPAVMLVPFVPVSVALFLFSLAFFSQQSWSGLIMTIPADTFPLSAVGTVAGMVGFAGSIGGALFGIVAGQLLGRGFSYTTLFCLVGTFHLIGYLVLVFAGGRIEPVRSKELRRLEGSL
jgi:ACS family hexuronate transporter-like MFS transporter